MPTVCHVLTQFANMRGTRNALRLRSRISNCANSSEATCVITIVCSVVMAGQLCRLCRSTVSPTHYCSLVSPWALQNNLSSRLGNLLGIQVDSTDGLPHIICSKCKRQFLTLEKASENLTAFQKMAQESFHAFSVRGDLKRKKECSTASAVGISPYIVRARPPLKRLTAKRLEFNSKLTKLLLLIQQNDNS